MELIIGMITIFLFSKITEQKKKEFATGKDAYSLLKSGFNEFPVYFPNCAVTLC
jgi:hypothetical protein